MIADNPPKKYDIFICHAKEDSATALTMCSFLERKEFRCWEASRDIQPGRDYAASIISAIQSSSIMVVILSGNANRSNHVRIEVERAFKNDASILPFRISDVQPEQALEYYLGAYQWLDALDGAPQDYFDELARVCASLLGRELPSSSPKTGEQPQPPPAIPELPPTGLIAEEKSEPSLPARDKPAEERPAPPVAEPKAVPPPPPIEKPAVSEEKPVVKEQAAPTPPIAPGNTQPPPVLPPPLRPGQQQLLMPPGQRGNSSKKPLIFTLVGIVVLVMLFFIYKATMQKHAVWFRNYTQTPVYIELDGNLTKIPVGDSIEYWAKNKYHLQTKASTYVLRDDGGVLGQNLEWHVDTTVNSWHNITYPLQIGANFFLLKMVNNSPSKFVHLKVISPQTLDYLYDTDVTIPNDGRTYHLGYYRSLSDLTVIARNESGQGWEWDCGRDFHYPNLWEQWIKLTKN